ncbi:DegT/DnrJ/EryC1/StrS family aminotransferase [Fluviispira sanaruensis]|uniref:DegT/DnrJ/EryC1/StrS family aminotransferase n=1 Tax=Fluviispira sanaruensis TaxID=2493639 RepID=A0A4P2VPF3_FLUSA|nr:DegT/DnrJ/EryC1/StrS family aminotransferase [Fluviispira sanaruensis]BBH54050.1 DegT/DnrJ/EryC1/StrS family aminotransferase [Fluviispira sanaruensis]
MTKMMPFIDLSRQQHRIRDSLEQKIKNVLDHGQYIMGPEVKELENMLANYVGVKHCVSVANGTDALLIAMLALDIKANDEIITSPFTFIATSEMIALLGAKPIYVDIHEQTYNIDPSQIEKAITERTKAIIPISIYGQCANMNEINEIAKKYNIPVIEDGAQSFGATHYDKKSCSLSKIGCTSFFPSKPLGCYGDGGACFTDDNEIAERMRSIRVHGQKERYHHTQIGINGRMDTLQAAILIAKLEIFEEEVILRNKLGDKFNALLKDYYMTPYIEKQNTSVYAQYTLRVGNRSQFMHNLKEIGIPTAIHYPTPAHLQPAFFDPKYPHKSLPISEKVASEVVSLPFHPYLLEDEIEFIISSVIKQST